MKTKQRGNQEGTFYQRKDGRWCGQIMLNNIRYTAYGKNKAECKRNLRDKVGKGKTLQIPSSLFIDYATQLIQDRRKRQEISQGYANNCLTTIKKTEHFFGYTPINEITVEKINEWTSHLISSHQKYSYIRVRVNIILQILNHAHKNKLIPQKLHLGDIHLGPKEIKSYPDLSIEKFIEKINQIKREDIRFGLLLLLHSGLRIGELRGLQWGDIDMEKNQIIVRRSMIQYAIPGNEITSPTKGKRIGEFVQLPLSFVPTLQEYVKDNYTTDDDWIFINKKTSKNEKRSVVKYQTFLYYAKKIMRALGIGKGFALHIFRHAHASLLVKNNIDLKTIQSQLRHTSIETTSRYLHELTNKSRPAIEQLKI